MFISHRLQDIVAVCDRVVVLYEGAKVAELQGSSTSLDEVISYMVGSGAAGSRKR